MSDEQDATASVSAGAMQVARQSDQKHCFSCGRILHTSAVSCPSCGAEQRAGAVAAAEPTTRLVAPGQAIFCYGCGSQIHAAAPICPKCGAPQRVARVARGHKDKTVAILLAFLLGGIGAHKFYLGNPGWGLIYLLFCWTFIPAVVAAIEGLIYLTQSDEKFAQAYG
jgi:TM2 domain-containing membrane protein YozV